MAVYGFIYLILIFLACFTLVHVLKLAVVGFLSVRRKKASPKETPEPPKEKPVYYIVEKKRMRRSYSKPKEIEFKDK